MRDMAEEPSKHAKSARKGKAVEQLITATCVLATGDELNALSALVDDEGVDLGFKRRNGTRVLDVQVKARFSDDDGSKSLRENNTFVADVRRETFRAREDLYMMYLAVHGSGGRDLGCVLVPSLALEAEGFAVKPKGKELVRFQASAAVDTDDKWRPLRYSREELPHRLMEVLVQLEPEVPQEVLADEDFEADERSRALCRTRFVPVSRRFGIAPCCSAPAL